jgi:hypothetical protein
MATERPLQSLHMLRKVKRQVMPPPRHTRSQVLLLLLVLVLVLVLVLLVLLLVPLLLLLLLLLLPETPLPVPYVTFEVRNHLGRLLSLNSFLSAFLQGDPVPRLVSPSKLFFELERQEIPPAINDQERNVEGVVYQ